MKTLKSLFAGTIVLLVLPVLLCSCSSSCTKEVKDTKPAPEAKPVPEVKPALETKSAPEVKPAPETKPVQDVNPAPEAKPVQDVNPAPEAKPVPEVKPASEEKPAPEVKPAQEVKKSNPSVKKEKSSAPLCEHTVRTGDNLWSLAVRYYGSGVQWKRILEANQAKIKNADFLEPGTVLTIPAAK